MKTSRNLSALFLIAATLLLSACEQPVYPPLAPQDARPMYDETAPEISYVLPSAGKPGMLIRIFGKNFGAEKADNLIWFGNVAATSVEAVNGTEIRVTVPTGAKTGELYLTIGDKTYKGPIFTITSAE
ncbi:hypothetical protein GCM10023187_12880 [Nibrella viscosa]|uniref:IPT/TIG domain-containing protein n=1 Tax=Nibrella viscosa TaxID=1084524 RepID=A0ABP8K430_9BACT